jgi:predicted GNAT family acetyltransferase
MTEQLIEIRDDPDEGAYVVDVDGERAGKAVYHMRGGRHLFVHTEIDDRFSGAGLGTSLVQYALDDVRAQQGTMVPICPFFAAYIDEHPEYGDIVDRKLADRINRKSKNRDS